MSTSMLADWLDRADPYHIQRLVFHQTLFVAILMILAYWVFQPGNLNAYIAPIFLVSVYDIPGSKKQRFQRLLFMFSALLCCICSFYLLYPFKFVFLFYSLAFLTLLYTLTLTYFPAIKNLTMLVIVNAALVLSTEPQANLQIMVTMLSSALLSMIVILSGIKGYAWPYVQIWRFAFAKYIQCLEKDIQNAMLQKSQEFFIQEVQHLNVMRLYRTLMPGFQLRKSLKVASNIRNIQFALSSIYFDKKNPFFWREIACNLHRLSIAIHRNQKCYICAISTKTKTDLQRKVVDYLNEAVSNWNILCLLT